MALKVNPITGLLDLVGSSSSGVTDHGALTGLSDDDHAQYLLLAGRTGTSNDPIISLDADGTIQGSGAAGSALHLFADGAGPGAHLQVNAGGEDRLIVGVDVDPTSALVPGGILQFVVVSDTGQARFGAHSASNVEDDSPTFFGIRAAGTVAAPTATQVSQTLLQFQGVGYDSTDTPAVAAIFAIDQDDTPHAGYVASRFTFVTFDTAGSPGLRLIIKNDGKTGINTGPDPMTVLPSMLTLVGQLSLGPSTSAMEEFVVEDDGNIETIFGVSGYSWPAAHAAGSLTNDGAGNLSWAAASGFIDGSGAAGQLAIFTDADTIAGDPDVTYDSGGNLLTVLGDIEGVRDTAGGTAVVRAHNSDNTSGTSQAVVNMRTGGASSGDPFANFEINGVVSWSLGIDNSDSDTFKLVRASELTTPVYLTVTTGGDVGIPAGDLTLGGQLLWPTGLGAITQVQGPTDQNLLIRSGTGRAVTIGPDGVEALLIASSGNVAVQAGTAGSTRQLIVGNDDNTNVLSHALLAVNAGGTSGGDPYARFVVPGGQTYSVGVDNSDSDNFKISRSSTLGTNDYIVINSSALVTLGGSLTTPSQLISTVATGTAPLAVTSTTAVTNLNADLLDGQHASAFQSVDTDLTEVAAVANVRGDLLITNSGPTWVRLGVGGANTVLHSDGTDPSWQALVDADIPNTLTLTNITGGTTFSADVIVGTTISGYNGLTTVGAGVPYIVATVDLTAQAAAVATTTLYAVPASRAGLYRITWYIKITTADPTSSTLGPVTYGWTDATDSTAQTALAGGNSGIGAYASSATGNNTGVKIAGTHTVWAAASSNITYAIAYTTNPGGVDMQYEYHAKVEALL